ncbi:hypothetical protein J2Z76_002421 [Sedimentibacter acidaminivorans]|uniref:Chorion class high-cysteine HCB protein 13 n=1 Tax=Sedimentibacter acidaminivorans TaxID=913099 RepID=A0ABS4GFX9_9FIRM|nr:hypothetical protein [Sedimentibacter acidaminivorans]MBP1926552.1 hypothetical protein [Sedimentibacter acidaminivorans]
MFQNILGYGDNGDSLLWFFLLLVVFACFCGGDNGLVGGIGGMEGDSLLFFFLLLIVLYCVLGNNDDCGC